MYVNMGRPPSFSVAIVCTSMLLLSYFDAVGGCGFEGTAITKINNKKEMQKS